MKFKTDENLPNEASEILRQFGHDVTTIFEKTLPWSADAELASVCQKENRALLTLDTDFADIRTYPLADYSGLIVFRLKHQDKLSVLQLVKRLLPMLTQKRLDKRLWIVDERRARIRS